MFLFLNIIKSLKLKWFPPQNIPTPHQNTQLNILFPIIYYFNYTVLLVMYLGWTQTFSYFLHNFLAVLLLKHWTIWHLHVCVCVSRAILIWVWKKLFSPRQQVFIRKKNQFFSSTQHLRIQFNNDIITISKENVSCIVMEWRYDLFSISPYILTLNYRVTIITIYHIQSSIPRVFIYSSHTSLKK